MFTKRSRYSKLTSVVTENKFGISVRSVGVRRLPETQGRFQHTVDSADRLDHLGYKYYDRTLQWWRICDANKSFLSPLQLLGKDARREALVTIKITHPQPLWQTYLAAIKALDGVIDANFGSVEQREAIVSFNENLAGSLGDIADSFIPLLNQAVLTQALASSLLDELETLSLELSDHELRIANPSPNQHWRIHDLSGQQHIDLIVSGDTIVVLPLNVTHEWVLRLLINSARFNAEDLFAVLDSFNIEYLDGVASKSNVGQIILIPTRAPG